RVEAERLLWIDRERVDTKIGQSIVDGAPIRSAVSALDQTSTVDACVEDIGVLGIDDKAGDSKRIGRPDAHGGPTCTAVNALENAVAFRSVHTCVECRRNLWIYGECGDIRGAQSGQSRGTPTDATVATLQNTRIAHARVQNRSEEH